jgi:voltage-gated potassium channel
VDERSRRIEGYFEIPLLVAALLVIPSLVISTSEHSTGLRDVGRILDWLIWGAFAAEVLVMLLIVPDRRGWLRRHPLEVVIVLFTPPVLPPALAGARILRLLRVLQLVPLARYSRRVFSLEGIRYAAVLAFVAVVGGGALFAAEQRGVDGWLGIYWAVTTMTGVGYGDVLPTTTLTHILAVLLMILGVGFTTLLTGAIAQRFLTPQIEELEEDDAAEARGDRLVLSELQEISRRLTAMEQRLEGGR